ncbi:MAG: hypothetical protein R2719_11165 [Micropruina sp.]
MTFPAIQAEAAGDHLDHGADVEVGGANPDRHHGQHRERGGQGEARHRHLTAR